MNNARLYAAILLFATLTASRTAAYVDHMSGFTLGSIVEQSPVVVVLRVEKVSLEKRAIIYSKVADLKGQHPTEEVKHQLKEGLQPHELKTILDWAEPGRIAVCFHDGKLSQTCIGRYWYQCHSTEEPWWAMTHGQGDLRFAYYGVAEKLPDHLKAMLAGEEVVIPALRRSGENALAREAVFANLPRGREFPIWRIKASLKMPAFAYLLGEEHLAGVGGGSAEEVSKLTKLLGDVSKRARAEACEELALIGATAKDALPALRVAVKDPDALVRVKAAYAIAQINPNEPDAVASLMADLKSATPGVRAATASALGQLGLRDRAVVEALARATKDESLMVRWAAVDALIQAGPVAVPAVPALLDALVDSDSNLRAVAAQALGEIGREGGEPEIRAALVKALEDDQLQVRRQAASSLIKLGAAGTPEAKQIVRILTDGLADSWEWGAALAVLVRLGPESVPALTDALQRGDVPVRKAAANLFMQLGAEDYRSAIPALIEALTDSDGYVRFRAAVALMHLGPQAKEAIPALNKMIKDDWGTNRWWAAVALGTIGRDKEVLPILLEALKDQGDASLRLYAARALGEIGSEAMSATTALTAALKDPDESVKHAAAEALKRIGPK